MGSSPRRSAATVASVASRSQGLTQRRGTVECARCARIDHHDIFDADDHRAPRTAYLSGVGVTGEGGRRLRGSEYHRDEMLLLCAPRKRGHYGIRRRVRSCDDVLGQR